jgi:hypothetical protein
MRRGVAHVKGVGVEGVKRVETEREAGGADGKRDGGQEVEIGTDGEMAGGAGGVGGLVRPK